MNWMILIAAIAAAVTTMGHFFVGTKEYLKPMLASDLDAVPKKVLEAVFHYVSVFLLLSAAALFAIAFGVGGEGSAHVAKFIACNYALFAIWEIVIALKSGIDKALAKMFHWVFFVIIAIFAWLGSGCCCCGG